MDKPVIALFSDLGTRDHYVGVMKAVILGIHPEARIVDITHKIQPHDVSEAAFMLMFSHAYFPTGTVFCCVVDPGVGSERKSVAIRMRYKPKHATLAHGNISYESEEDMVYILVSPDNGVVTGMLNSNEVTI